MTEPDYAKIDEGIIPVIKLLMKHGYQTSESCQGGPGHGYLYPTVLFYATQQGCVDALAMLRANGYEMYSCRLTKNRRTPGYRSSPYWLLRLHPTERPSMWQSMLNTFMLTLDLAD